ncbi:hypothetical protein KM043_013785 [Ampulex compressa]|nr:hypothetical protein KM043_013785 [Ampulex compressa]
MTLPVSSYEELLIQVRELTHETILLQRQLSSDLYDNANPPDVNHNFSFVQKSYEKGKLLTDNVIRQCEKSRKIERGQSPLAEYSNFAFRPRFCQNLENTDGVQSGELTSRLLAWRSRRYHPIFLQSPRLEAEEMPVESGERIFEVAGRSTSPSKERSEIETRNRYTATTTTTTTTTMIPLPRTGQFAFSSQNQKIVKTEKNRLRLIMGSREEDGLEKEHRRYAVEKRLQEDNSRLAGIGAPSYHDYGSFGRKEGAEARRVGSVPEPSRYSASVGVEGLVGGRGPQRRPRVIEAATPLGTGAAQEPESCADGAAAYTTPVVVAAAPATSATSGAARCAPIKPALQTPLDVAGPRSRYYLGHAETNKEDAMEAKEEDERRSSTPSPEVYVRSNKRYNEDGSSEDENKVDCPLQAHRLPSSYRGTWPIRRDLWANQQMGFAAQQSTSVTAHNDVASVMSFSSNSGTPLDCSAEMQGHRRLGAKVDVVYNLLGMLGSTEGREDMSATLLSMSNSIDSCLVMRQSGCLPLLVQLIHAPGQDLETRERASRALHNVVHAKSDERPGRREARVLRFLEQLRDYCQALRASLETGQIPDDLERHPGPTIAALMKLSFDEAHRHAMCQLGGLHAVAELIEMDHMAHGSECDDQNCITLRRYAGMALTNLTFGDGNNKALLCSFREFMKALVSQLRSPSDDLRQVTASVLRNLSWRADNSSKQTLREVGAVTGLMKAAMEGRKESTLKSILSALWNLSAHCSTNKVDICAVEGALAFLVDMLSYKAPSKTLAIVENAGGILRNVSSHVAVREDYRTIVRERGCLQVLLQQLRSPSLTVVSNACGALWNLSARCPQDQRLLWDLGAVPMLRSLVHSKHKMISMGSSAALKNLLSARPGCSNLVHLDSTARGLGLSTLPSLVARRQRALEQEIDQNLSETCENIEPSTSPTNKDDKFAFKVDHSFLGINGRGLRSYQFHNQSGGAKCNGVARSESRDSMRSVTSTHSDTMFERVNRHVLNGMSPTDVQMKQQSSSLHSAIGFDGGVAGEGHGKSSSAEKKYTLRYKNAIPDRLRPSDVFNEISELRPTNSTMSWSSTGDQESACSQVLLHSSMEDNLPMLNQSLSSTSKANSQSSISEGTELTLCPKAECFCATPKSTIAPPTTLSFVKEPSSTKESTAYTAIYTDKAAGLHQHNSLSSIQKAISPTVSHATEGNLFSDYAETDLDQPTDYSLRYAEQTLEEDEKQHSGYFVGNERRLVDEDTIKTYCTEGTPRETSLNSSRAASDSDLQEDNRMKSMSRKLLEQKLKNREQAGYESSSLSGIHEARSFKESTSELGLECAKQIIEEKRQSQAVCYFKVKTPEFEPLRNAEESAGRSSVRSESSIRTTPTKIPSRKFQYDESNTLGSTSIDIKIDQVSDGDEDDEDLLTACINIGMQNNRHRHSFIGNSYEKLPRSESNLTRYQTSGALDQMEANAATNNEFDTRQAESQEEISTDTSKEMNKDIASKTDGVSQLGCVVLNQEERIYPQSISLCSKGVTEADASNQHKSPLDNPENQTDNKANSTMDEINITDPTLSSSISKDSIDGISETSKIDAKLEDQEAKLKQKVSCEKEESNGNSPIETDKWAHLQQNNIVETSMQRSYTKVTDSESSESIDSVEQSEHALLELCIQSGITKTIDNTPIVQPTCKYGKSTLEIDGEQEHIMLDIYKTSSQIDGVGDELVGSPYKSSHSNDHSAKHTDEEAYRRQRDPDAMIASLDRLTAALVQQTEAIRERDSSAMKQSTVSDTWNEESPNEVSFPSISMSAPLIASFKSDVQEDPTETRSSEGPRSMTDSKIIQIEAIRLAEAVDAEAMKHNELETTSMTSIDLDAIKPPSSMGSLLSLTASYTDPTDTTETFLKRDRCYSTSLPPVQIKSLLTTESRNGRKKSLPLGVVAKRAIGQGQSHAGSLENLLNECTNSHIENVKPPSVMDELPDVGDMENSMLSVASITSEIADAKEQDSQSLTISDPVFDLLKPVANILSMTCMRYAEAMQVSANNSLSECLENINPPSLFNEVQEMDESTMEPVTETICSDTLCIDVELRTEEAANPSHSIVVDKDEEMDNDTDEAATPISSEYCVSSSAESTPKRRLHRNNHLTPKQKRNLAKERYKTYTIAAEIVKKEEERRKQEGTSNEADRIPRGKCSPFSKLTPKQRRQEDRARFQTQVLENPFPDLRPPTRVKQDIDEEPQQRRSPEKSSPTSPVKSAIPTLTKLPVCKALRKKRTDHKENRERYRTRTLNDSEIVVKDAECSPPSTGEKQVDTVHDIKPEEIQSMLEQNATIVLNTLNESSKANEVPAEDLMLDCETLSLVSNDSESERNLRMRFVSGLSRKLISTCVQQKTEAQNVEQEPEERRENEEEPGTTKPCEETGTSDGGESESEDKSNKSEEQPRETKRPRIVKPDMTRDLSADSNGTDKSEPENPKAIRGRRKPLYSNPITRKPTPQSSPLKQANPISGIPIGRSNTSPIVRATRATTLRQNNNTPNAATKESAKTSKGAGASCEAEKRARNLSAPSKRASVPQKGSSLTFTKSMKRHSTPPSCPSNFQSEGKSEATVKPLERQGTFTKDEPEVENAPTVVSSGSPIKTKIAKPIRGGSSKVHPVAAKSKISVKPHQAHQSKITKANSSDKIPPAKGLPIPPKRLPPNKPTATGKAPNTSIPQSDGSKSFRKAGPLGQRSNSNSSIVSNSSAGMQTRKLAKEATSKIASLWKKVEESKNKQRLEKPDTRQWVVPSADEIDSTDLNQPPSFRLFRSSTFEGVPQEGDHEESSLYKSKSRNPLAMGAQVGGAKYRNSCDLSAINDAPCKIPVKSSEGSACRKSGVQPGEDTVILRKQQSAESAGVGGSGGAETDVTKRISRLGSFIRVDPPTGESGAHAYVSTNGVRALASAIVPPFNYNPKQDIPSPAARVASDDG